MTNAQGRLSSALSDRYRIERELGRGGMATVYLAHDLKHDRDVAIKVLHEDLGATLGPERFLSEIKTTAKLQHPHILPLLDSGEAGGLLFYVMPYVAGETLRDRLTRETQLPIEDAVRIAREVADALGHAHGHGIIHRDIKPENILLQGGHALVADFGIALAVQRAGGSRLTQTGLSLGTPQYMAPEQAMGDKLVDARADLYALGCVLYEMLTGSPPFTGPSAQAIVAKVITTEPESVTAQRQTVPAHIADAVRIALQKLPADRFANASDFAAALEGKGVSPTLARSGTAASAARARTRAVPLAATVVTGLAMLAVGVVAARIVWPPSVSDSPTTRIMIEFPRDQAPRRPHTIKMLAPLPDGSGLLYSGPGTTTSTQFWIRHWDQLGATRAPRIVEGGCCAVFSPHGDTIAYLAPPHKLLVMSLSGGAPLTVADSGLTSVTDLVGGVDWGDDGMLYASAIDGLVRVAPSGGKMEVVSRLDAQQDTSWLLYPSVLPGARGVLVTLMPKAGAWDRNRAKIAVVDLRSHTVQPVATGTRAIYAPSGHIVFANANGVLWAAPFDARALRVTGKERELGDTVDVAAALGDFALTKSGSLVYTKSGVATSDVQWVDRHGDGTSISTDLNEIAVHSPELSPDGKQLAVVVESDGSYNIWVKSFEGSTKSRLTFKGDNIGPSWRPPGFRTVSFGSRLQGNNRLFLYEAPANGAGQSVALDIHDRRSAVGHTWSPDGKWLVYRTNDQEQGNGDIMGIRLGVDTAPRPLMATNAEELSPAISPDGHWIAYSSNESGTRQVYVRPFPETMSAVYQISAMGGINPKWNRNGRELFFLDGAFSMVSVPVTLGASAVTGQAQVLFSAARFASNAYEPQYDVAPDGQHFVMIKETSDNEVHVVVVSNFLAELKRRFRE